jgi:hypothetical protein
MDTRWGPCEIEPGYLNIIQLNFWSLSKNYHFATCVSAVNVAYRGIDVYKTKSRSLSHTANSHAVRRLTCNSY